MEAAIAAGMEVTIITIDVQGAFDTLLVKQLLACITKQGWPLLLFLLICSFLTNRKVRVKLEKSTTPEYRAAYRTPQGSLLSPVLYMLYLAELLVQDTTLYFGYTDNICLYRATGLLNNNIQLLASNVQDILA
jgi:hypothetical protein